MSIYQIISRALNDEGRLPRNFELPRKETPPLSDRISKDMKKLGFKFVGSTIVCSYLQAIGAVNDHIEGCSFKVCEEKIK